MMSRPHRDSKSKAKKTLGVLADGESSDEEAKAYRCPPPLRQRIGIPGLHENLESSPPPVSSTGGRGLLAASRKKLPLTQGRGRGTLAVSRS